MPHKAPHQSLPVLPLDTDTAEVADRVLSAGSRAVDKAVGTQSPADTAADKPVPAHTGADMVEDTAAGTPPLVGTEVGTEVDIARKLPCHSGQAE